MGLPGNPVSSFVTFAAACGRCCCALQGAPTAAAPRAAADAGGLRLAPPDKRREFLRVRLNAAGGLDLFANQSSGVLTSAVWADGLVDNPPGRPFAGDTVRLPAGFAELLA
jgi:molybdopterin molybdotransferase